MLPRRMRQRFAGDEEQHLTDVEGRMRDEPFLFEDEISCLRGDLDTALMAIEGKDTELRSLTDYNRRLVETNASLVCRLEVAAPEFMCPITDVSYVLRCVCGDHHGLIA